MAHEPKKRHSRARQGKRRAAIHLDTVKSVVCPNCGAPQISHAVCETCGFYKGREVIKKAKKDSSSATSQPAA